VDVLAAQRQTAVAESIFAVFNHDALVGAVVRVRVGPGAFASFQGHSVVVDGHVAAAHVHVLAGIDVDGVR
jgi:hypothetical protein